jgi:RNA polymerase sigma-70 factor (ECF subfamily)
MSYESPARPENIGNALSISQMNPEAVDVLVSRYRRILYSVAYRVLRNHQDAEDAVQRCLLSASYNLPQFEYEGGFRSWLVRVLIDEALAILHKRQDRVDHSLRDYPGLAQLSAS